MNRPKFLYIFAIFLTLYHVIARIGLAIDLQWHLDVGRDSMFTPPHIMILAGFPICLLLSIYYVIVCSKDLRKGIEVNGIQIFGLIAPGYIWMILIGMFSLTIGGVYDDYWHAQYGIDTTVLTPPHMLTLFGGIIAEIASVLLVLALMKENNSNFKGLDLLASLLLWTVFFHSSFLFLNYIDPKLAITSLFGLDLLLHLFFGPFVTYCLIVMTQKWFGNRVLLYLGIITIIFQSSMFYFIPISVELLMGPSHVYRPGAPSIVWAGHCISIWFLPVIILIIKFNLLNKEYLLIPLLVLSDVLFSPIFPINYIGQVGLFSTIVSVSLAILLIFQSRKLIHKFVTELANYSNNKYFHFKPRLRIIAITIALILVSPVSAHGNQFEEGSGFDAPMRVQVDLNGTEVWVEFMLWPPKAPQDCDILLVANESEKTIESMWTEIVFFSENGEVRMIQEFDQYLDQTIWFGKNYFTFSGNQSIQIKAIIDGNEEMANITIEVEPPASIPIWLAWTLSSIWVFLMFYSSYYFAEKLRRGDECE